MIGKVFYYAKSAKCTFSLLQNVAYSTSYMTSLRTRDCHKILQYSPKVLGTLTKI